jgi:hypothetical protein
VIYGDVWSICVIYRRQYIEMYGSDARRDGADNRYDMYEGYVYAYVYACMYMYV